MQIKGQPQWVSCAVLSVALKQLHGTACDQEWEDIEKERNNLAGFQAKKPWELFTDRSVRWQLISILLLNCAQQLNGINAVRPWGYTDLVLSPVLLSLIWINILLIVCIGIFRDWKTPRWLLVLIWNLFFLSVLLADLLLRKLLVPAVRYSQW